MFHSISAFNNAGFSLWSDSLLGYQDNVVVCGVIAALVLAGGIGWRVLQDLWTNRRGPQHWRGLSLHSRIVLRSSALLVVTGTLLLLFTERLAPTGVIGGLPLLRKAGLSMFQVISARTAGFVSVPLSQETISHAGLFLLILLMFVGASPGGTGGGKSKRGTRGGKGGKSRSKGSSGKSPALAAPEAASRPPPLQCCSAPRARPWRTATRW